MASVALISDMGLAPAFAVDVTGALTLTYAMPTLKITSFDIIGFDMTPYLKSETKGEGTLIVSLGTHTFLKVKIAREGE